MEKVTVIYIIAISLQLAGAVILIINYCRNTHNQIIDRYFPGSNLVERDNKDNIVLEKERVQEVVREIFMNRCAFFYIGAGYIVGIYGEAGKTNKCIISILVIIGSFLLNSVFTSVSTYSTNTTFYKKKYIKDNNIGI